MIVRYFQTLETCYFCLCRCFSPANLLAVKTPLMALTTRISTSISPCYANPEAYLDINVPNLFSIVKFIAGVVDFSDGCLQGLKIVPETFYNIKGFADFFVIVRLGRIMSIRI